MSRRRPSGVDELEIVFEGFERANEGEAADVSFGHGPFGSGPSGHRPPRSGRSRWAIALAVVGAVGLAVWFLATRDGHAPVESAGPQATPTTDAATATTPPRASATPATTVDQPRSSSTGRNPSTVVTSAVDGAPLLGGTTGYTLHFTDQGGSTAFALQVDSGELREIAVRSGMSQAVVTPGRIVGISYDGRLSIVGNDGVVEVGPPALAVTAVGDGSVWVAVPDGGRLRLNHLIPVSDLVTESRMTPGPTLALVGSDAAANPVVLGADGHLYAISGDGVGSAISVGSAVAHDAGLGNMAIAGAYGETICSPEMRCADVLHDAGGHIVQLVTTDPSGRSYSFSPDGRRVAVVDSGAHRIEVYDFSGASPFALDVGKAGAAQVPSWSPDGRFVFTYVNRQVRWGDVTTGQTGAFQLTRPGTAFVLVGVE